jgi:hypothetical protein
MGNLVCCCFHLGARLGWCKAAEISAASVKRRENGQMRLKYGHMLGECALMPAKASPCAAPLIK